MCHTPGTWLCRSCQSRYLTENLPECAVCRKVSTGFVTHPQCKTDFPTDQVVILWRYNRLGRAFMNKLKLGLRYRIVDHFIGIAQSKIHVLIPPTSILIPVPAHPLRLKERGFNQSEIIANSIAQITGCTTLNALSRSHLGTHQTGTSRRERLLQKSNEFLIKKELHSRLKNEKIVIVDDVCTTGATLHNCALALVPVQPKSISAIALFRGKKTKSNHG
ncbi:ComF family protein [Candidatus Dojkabacteria bacterium]|nr:ComF family protein [Candidatus Dojkabacteria bacterium]